MENRLSADQQLSAAFQCLQRVIVGKGVAIDELHASNQELGEVLDNLLNARGDLRASLESDGFHGIVYTEVQPKGDPRDLKLEDLERQAEVVLRKCQTVIQESMQLRAKAKKMRAVLSAASDGHLGTDGHAKVAEAQYDPLSKRERQVLALIVAGKSSKQIAAELGISFKTAVTHRASIMGKMEVHEIASVVREAIRRGLA
jgi:DNA-binding CsgD family transcriptional regulator